MILTVSALAFVLAAAPAAEGASGAPPAAGSNVSITLTVGRMGGPGGTTEKIYKFVGQDGRNSKILMGWRTPIPTRASDQTTAAPSSTSYIYQNVGVSAELETQDLKDGRFHVWGQVEISGTRDGASTASPTPDGKPPLIGTFQQELHVVVPKGKKVRVAEAPDPEAGTLYLELRVDSLE